MNQDDMEGERAPIATGMAGVFVAGIGRIVGFVSRHWLGLLNLVFVVYVSLPFLAPVFMRVGATMPARVIYTIYLPFCHQLPERSYFLFGRSPTYSLEELQTDGVATGNLFQRRHYIGDDVHGYKVALCERDLAIYGSMALVGMVLAVRRWRVPRLRLFWYVLIAVVPIALDGGTQLIGLRESTWWLRTLTGVLFGGGTLWFVYPYLSEAFTAEQK
jgi:uncharacterized membrane protein